MTLLYVILIFPQTILNPCWLALRIVFVSPCLGMLIEVKFFAFPTFSLNPVLQSHAIIV